MKKCFWSFILIVSLLSMIVTPFQTHAADERAIVEYWAPDFYQDTNSTYGYKADYITNFNYDGDWVGNNNWENLDYYNTPAYIYYSFVETSTHYFIGYNAFHARDDGPIRDLDAHENDFEGMLVVVRKDGSPYGQFQLMETLAHDQWYQYTNDPAITTGSDNVDGGVLFRDSHPKVFVQANGQSPWNGHGMQHYDGSGAPGGDGIVYQYGGWAEVPTDGSGNWARTYSYQLLSIDELWNRRENIGSGNTFGAWGKLDGDNYKEDAANAPWGWDDSDDGATFKGDAFADPAHFVDTHLNGLGNFSHDYVNHRYYTHQVTIQSISSEKNRDPFGGKSDIYPRVDVNGDKVTDDRLWKKDDATLSTQYSVRWGADQAVDGNQYSSFVNHRMLAHPPNSKVEIVILDSDDGNDDEMGRLVSIPDVGQTITYNQTWIPTGEAKVTGSVTRVR